VVLLMIDPGLKDRVALVTGGNNPHGIGAATALALAAQGARVFVHFFRERGGPGAASGGEGDDAKSPGLPYFFAMQAKSADEVVQAVREAGGEADSREADLSDPAAVAALFDRAEQRFGPVEVLVNNAAAYEADTFLPASAPDREDRAIWDEGPVPSTITADSHDHHFAVNTRAAALLMAEFVRRLVGHQRQWGRIVNVSADCSWGSPGEVSYRASKYALESYSRSAAAELGPLGITMNVVSPGPVQTGYMTPDFERELAAEIPLGRVGRPEDVADTIVFLASEQARWLTGQLITVHGGHRMALGI
jgi:3-oxoacyl-[acyl-carrier protein] reductase